MKKPGFLSRFSIGKQILIGFAPALAILCFLAFTSFGNFNTFFQNFDDLKSNTRDNIIFLEIKKDIAELQRHALVYSYVGYKGVLRKVAHLEEKLDLKFDTIRPVVKQDEELKDRFDRLFGHYVNYKENFDAAVIERGKIRNLTQKTLKPLSQKSHDILEKLTTTYQQSGDLQKAFLALQMDNKLREVDNSLLSFEISPDASITKATKQLLLDIQNIALTLKKDATSNAQEIDTLIQILQDYQSSFSEMIRINRTYLQLINVVLAGKAAEIDALSTEMDELFDNRTEEFGTQINHNLREAQNKYISLTIIAGMIGVLCAWFIAMGIARPVRKMAGTLSDIAEGKPDTHIPGQKRNDEVGEMARAAEDFKDMGIRIQTQSRQIRNSQAQLSAIVDNMVDGLFTVDQNGIIQSFNGACETIFGYKSKEVVGQDFKIIMSTKSYKRYHEYLKNYKNGTSTTKVPENAEIEGKRKSGSIFPMELSVSELHMDDGRLYTGIVRDITDRKQAQDALIEANAELEEFAYRTSHDLRSPLVSSIGLIGVAKDSMAEKEYDRAIMSMDHVYNSMRKLETLITDILALTQAKNADEDEQEINVNEVVEEALNKFSHMENFDRLAITQDIRHKKPITLKKNRFVLIAENLISNAIKYQDPKKEESFVKISFYKKAEHLIFEVSDNGLGIPKDQQDKMFTMFKRFHSRVSFGSGLGLYMIKKSADILDGQVSYKDTKDGSLFTLKIPAKK